ncbi:hypothetical protein CMV_013571 [Castanea mollissima]|uniref:Uncharacterized protein n=1 Tax=Castanea mollissima TaxID=60419 RepID=A0A8J4VLS2_9ROSI|nr:hypothetical protein CMV_013571 [Castanea mollissima]
MAYLKSNAFLLLGLLFAVVALISSESSAREQVPSQTYESDSMEEANINAELLKERNRERSIHRKCSNRGHRGPDESDAIAMQETDINAELRHEELSFQRNQRHRNSFIQYQSGYYCCRQPNMK